MSWIDSLEARLGRFAIPGLIRLIVGFQALVFILGRMNPVFLQSLVLDRQAVLSGEVWRLVTFLFVPDTMNLFWIIFALYFLWLIGEGLEQALGSFKLNLYFALGALSAIFAAFFFGVGMNNSLLSLSLLFAFATIYPNFTVMAYLILPIKVMWLALLSVGFVLWSLLTGETAVRMAVICSFVNYAVFFLPHWIHLWRHKGEVAVRRKRFESSKLTDDEALHRCKVCGRTEISDPELNFRIAADGEDYCSEHLPGKTQ